MFVKVQVRDFSFESWKNPASYVIVRDFLSKQNFKHVIYTDGSKVQDFAGLAGVLNGNTIFSNAMHPNYCFLHIELKVSKSFTSPLETISPKSVKCN